jgi:hypothetical protein
MGEGAKNNRVIYDHIGYGFTARFWKRPPKLPEDDIIESMADTLKEFIPDKLQNLIARQDELAKIREKQLKEIDSKTNVSRVAEYIFTFDVEYSYMEYFIIQRWLKYWLQLLAKVDDKIKLVETSSEISETEVEFAREYPIADLYDGRLRGSTRLSGLCPFHNEDSPSFIIFTDDNKFYCFGCHEHGDSIDFYMKQNKVGFMQAVKKLNNFT